MEPPPLRPPDPSSLWVGVVLGVVLGLLGWAAFLLGILAMYGGPSVVPFAYAGWGVAALIGAAVPAWTYRRGRRRRAQGVLIGYGLVLLAFGACVLTLR